MVVVEGKREKGLGDETYSIEMKMRHTRGASEAVTVRVQFTVTVTLTLFVQTLHHAENPYDEDKATTRRFRGYRGGESPVTRGPRT